MTGTATAAMAPIFADGFEAGNTTARSAETTGQAVLPTSLAGGWGPLRYPAVVAKRHVTEVGLKLAPELLGLELASPARRTIAIAIDAAILWVPSLLVAMAVSWATLAIRQPAALHALTGLFSRRLATPEAQQGAMRDLIPLMVKYHMPGTPPEVAVAWHEGDVDRAVAALRDSNIMIVLNVSNAGRPREGEIRIELGRLMPRVVRLAAFYGLAALYFAWLTSRRREATLGKRWLGIRVVRLDGSRMGFVMSFERFVGYAQVPGSLFTALLDFWRDSNRRLPHDRLAGTLVVRLGAGGERG